MNLGIKNKVALVAAASQGLGKASAMALAREGAHLAICSRDMTALRKTADEITQATGVRVLPIQADVTQPDHITGLVDATVKEYGTIHILVNNAGGPPAGHLLLLSDEEWQKGVELTLLSTVRLTRAVLPMMADQHWGRIVTIVSIAAKQPINDLLISSTLRPGILGLSKIVSNQYAKMNVTINTVLPGLIMTNRQVELMQARSARQNITMEQYLEDAAKDIPAGRLGRPEELGSVVAFLASEHAGFISGTSVLVDGGMAKGI